MKRKIFVDSEPFEQMKAENKTLREVLGALKDAIADVFGEGFKENEKEKSTSKEEVQQTTPSNSSINIEVKDCDTVWDSFSDDKDKEVDSEQAVATTCSDDEDSDNDLVSMFNKLFDQMLDGDDYVDIDVEDKSEEGETEDETQVDVPQQIVDLFDSNDDFIKHFKKVFGILSDKNDDKPTNATEYTNDNKADIWPHSHSYNKKPQTKKELRETIKKIVEDEGFNADLNDIDVSNITDMSNLFDFNVYSPSFGGEVPVKKNFNGHIEKWDVSNVENMSFLFSHCENFNRDISNWNTSSLKYVSYMFCGCHKFNQDLSKWNVSNVVNMSSMFDNCFQFNSDISKWDVSKVEDMQGMFRNCSKFNQPIGQWNLNTDVYVNNMFRDTYSFNQDLSNWIIKKRTVDGMIHYNDDWMFGGQTKIETKNKPIIVVYEFISVKRSKHNYVCWTNLSNKDRKLWNLKVDYIADYDAYDSVPSIDDIIEYHFKGTNANIIKNQIVYTKESEQPLYMTNQPKTVNCYKCTFESDGANSKCEFEKEDNTKKSLKALAVQKFNTETKKKENEEIAKEDSFIYNLTACINNILIAFVEGRMNEVNQSFHKLEINNLENGTKEFRLTIIPTPQEQIDFISTDFAHKLYSAEYQKLLQIICHSKDLTDKLIDSIKQRTDFDDVYMLTEKYHNEDDNYAIYIYMLAKQ